MKRKLVIGDVHGGLIALKQVLERCNYDPFEDQLIFLGDYVDGWPESSEVIQFLIDLDKVSKLDNIFILGNHDAWCKEWLQNGIQKPMWVQQGGQATIDSYMKTGYLTEDSHRNFFNKLHNYYIDDQNRVFVHGGYTALEGAGHEEHAADYYWDRQLFSAALSSSFQNDSLVPNEKLPIRLRPHKEIYVGHTSTVNWNYSRGALKAPEGYKKGEYIMTPINACNVWNMDTGGGFYGKLTVMDIDTKEYWQSDLVKELYPEHKGR